MSAALAVAALAGCTKNDWTIRFQTMAAKAAQQEISGEWFEEDSSEIDLGDFLIDVPLRNTHASLVVECHLFATVASGDHARFKERLEQVRQRLRHEVILSVRGLSPEHFAELNLATLKRTIATAAAGVLDEPPIKEIGFYHLAYREE